jgi:hypothetical protein
MTFYDVLIAAWNSSIQPPTGVTGTGLSSGQTTIQKLININGWTVTGSIPTSLLTTGSALANCISFSEFNALLPTQQSNLMGLLQIQGGLLGGSTNVGLLTAGMFLNYFGSSSVTIANMTALAKATSQSWAQANGYTYFSGTNQGNINDGDLGAAGLK